MIASVPLTILCVTIPPQSLSSLCNLAASEGVVFGSRCHASFLAERKKNYWHNDKDCKTKTCHNEEGVLDTEVLDPRRVDEQNYDGDDVAAEYNDHHCISDDLIGRSAISKTPVSVAFWKKLEEKYVRLGSSPAHMSKRRRRK